MRSTGEGSGDGESEDGRCAASDGREAVVGFGDPAFVMPDAVADAVAALRTVAAVDVRAESDDDLLGRFDGLEMWTG